MVTIGGDNRRHTGPESENLRTASRCTFLVEVFTHDSLSAAFFSPFDPPVSEQTSGSHAALGCFRSGSAQEIPNRNLGSKNQNKKQNGENYDNGAGSIQILGERDGQRLLLPPAAQLAPPAA